MLEECRYCGFKHVDQSCVEFKRNHVSNRVNPYCTKCGRRLYNEKVRELRGSGTECTMRSLSCSHAT